MRHGEVAQEGVLEYRDNVEINLKMRSTQRKLPTADWLLLMQALIQKKIIWKILNTNGKNCKLQKVNLQSKVNHK